MKNRFKLTIGFLIFSVVVFIVAAVVITEAARKNEESNVIEVVSEQSNRDAQVIAGVVTGMALASEQGPTAFGAPGESAFDSMTMSAFFQSSNIVGLSLFDVDGTVLWSSSTSISSKLEEVGGAFGDAASGETITHLDKNVEFVSFDGSTVHGDITSTYIPLLDLATEQPQQILAVSREVTDTLRTRIDAARSSMLKTVFSALGGSFIVLFGVVMTADLLIGRSRSRALTHERALADEKIVANKLEMENQQLRQMNEERDRFLSMVSHELRTPLTTIMGFTEVLRRRQDGDKRESNLKHLEVMHRNGEHLNSLIEEMLEITRIQAGEFKVEKEGFSFAQLLEQVKESGQVLVKARRQTLRVEGDVKDVELHGDRRRVMQVMLNLLSNASKYSPTGSTVTLKITYTAGSVEISVGDEGAGIPEDEFRLLFERFYRRDDEATRSESGLGLGLSIVEAIVNAHNGSIRVDSEVGVGTVMTVALPGARKGMAIQQASAQTEFELRQLRRRRDLRALPAIARAS